MRTEVRVSTVISVIGHSLLVLWLLLVALWNPLNSKEEIAVMELVHFPDGTEVTVGASTAPAPDYAAEPAPAEEDPLPVTESTPMPTLDIPSMPSIEQLDIPPLPEPLPEPTPKPQPAPKPTLAPKPAPQPVAPPKILTEEEFRKLHGNKKPQPAPAPVRKAVVAPTISSPNIRVSVPAISRNQSSGLPTGTPNRTNSSVSGAAQGPLQENYLNRVRSILDQTWERPVHLPKGLSVDVEFRVERNGQIVLLRFLRTSGNTEFDESVRRAFRNAARAPATPDGRTWVESVAFMLE